MSLNTVALQGKFGKDPDLRYTGSGKAVLSGTLAVDRNFKNANGEKETDWINIVVWGKQAETIANYFKKGDEIIVTGSIQVRSYDDKQGNKRYATEINVNGFSFTSGRKSEGKQQSQQSDPFAGKGSSIDVKDDDLPF